MTQKVVASAATNVTNIKGDTLEKTNREYGTDLYCNDRTPVWRLFSATKHTARSSTSFKKILSTQTDQEDTGDYERSGKQTHAPTRLPEKDDADQNPHQHAHLTNENGVAHGGETQAIAE